MPQPAYKFPPKKDGPNWPAQGEWTYKDYLRLPEDGNRYEVIWGSLYVSATPFPEHQYSVGKLIRFFDVFVSDSGLGTVLPAPLDILLPKGIASPIQPDLAVFRKGNEPAPDQAFEGVPDLVVEVLSPRTRRRDKKLKFIAYEEAGVPEYWLVDPDARTVEVYMWEKGKGYIEFIRGGLGDEVWSSALPGLRVKVTDLFMS
ncbi:MAG TPA: Uma2 family endonuclease [Thermoanaerobaculia bacterium]|jgi:Uma2 family endonuclease|nr:Uma2 family endonuclease [Thermoanaerobaculia bacterium]